MSEFLSFLQKMAEHIGVERSNLRLCQDRTEQEIAANILNEINIFLYQKNETLENEYISEFHKYWKDNHELILNPTIDNNSCKRVARILEDIYTINTICVQLNTLDLTHEQIANVRFFSAIQDFKIDISANVNPFELYKHNPRYFNADDILDNELLIDEFLNRIGAKSQRDKRKKWMQESASLLKERYNSNAYTINQKHNGDALAIKNALVEPEGYGFSQKKADMFLRDMADLGVWSYAANIDKINVMSDKNTMRIALRTGILQTRIPLLASYLDVYCYQYGLIDKWNVLAWRNVWNKWGELPNNHRPQTPASIDYFIYRMGKLACWKSPQRRKCKPNHPIKQKWLESQIRQDQLIFNSNKYCVFDDICPAERRILNHPMSISILGDTGWESGKTNNGGGGGIQS